MTLNRFRCVIAGICARRCDVFVNLAVFDPSLLKTQIRSVEKVEVLRKLLVWVLLQHPDPCDVFAPSIPTRRIDNDVAWLWDRQPSAKPDHMNPSSPIGVQNGRLCWEPAMATLP
jgi:hypothetical protein